MTTQFIVIGDPHINSTVGLCAPGVNLDDGGTYHLNRTQHWLWRSWLEFWDEVSKLEGRKIVCFMGDMGELDTKRRSVQLVSPNKSTILKTIRSTIEPAYDNSDLVIVIRGTPAHEGKGCWVEEEIASDLDSAVVDKERKRSSWYHLRITIDGVRFDLSHHASMTGNPWGRGNSANNVAHKLVYNYMVTMNQPPPDVAHRAHNHVLAESWGFPTQLIYTPAWTSATEFAYRAGYENTLADVGGIIWTLDAGKKEKQVILFEPKEMRRVWAMKL